MDFTSEDNILKVLSGFNPWWKTGMLPKHFIKPIRRFAYFEAMKALNHPDIRRMVIISGARRIGKTTIAYQMIEELINTGIRPQKIVYISFDHPLLKLCNLQEILDVFHTNIYPDHDVYYFFDEIQYASDWDSWLKIIYDTQPETRAVATGSASPVLIDKSSESGVGRWNVISVPTLSFYEYCEMLNIESPIIPKDIKPTQIINLSLPEQNNLFMSLAPLQRHFNRYLSVGGFPELALSKDDMYAGAVLRDDVVDKVLKRDIPSLYNIRSVTDLERIFLYLCYHSSSIVSMETIAKQLNGVSRPTVEKYIQYLEGANLIYRSKPVGIGGKKVLKSQPKIYIADAAIRNAVLMQDDLLTNPEEMGIMVETAVYKHIKAYYYKKSVQVGYMRIGSSGKEIDVVVDYPTGRINIEVKYREGYAIGEKEAIVQMAECAASSILITKKDDDYGVLNVCDKVYRIPAFAFLYLLGAAEKQWYMNN